MSLIGGHVEGEDIRMELYEDAWGPFDDDE